MKISKKKLFRLLQSLVWLTLAITGIIVFASATRDNTTLICNSLIIDIDKSDTRQFVSEKDVKHTLLLGDANIMVGEKIGEINFGHLEKDLNKNPYIKNAQIYIDAHGNIKVKIEQREPIFKVINRQGVSYYIDENGKKMPLSANFTLRLPIVTGFLDDNGDDRGLVESCILEDLQKMVVYIRQNKFWSAEIEQINVSKSKDIELIPKLGSHKIIFGNIDRMEEKFESLYIFYQEGLKYVGWKQYKEVNLKFKDQIIAKKF